MFFPGRSGKNTRLFYPAEYPSTGQGISCSLYRPSRSLSLSVADMMNSRSDVLTREMLVFPVRGGLLIVRNYLSALITTKEPLPKPSFMAVGSSSCAAWSSDRYGKGCSSNHTSYCRAFLSKASTPGMLFLLLDLPRHLQKRINNLWIKLGPCQGANIFSNFVL